MLVSVFVLFSQGNRLLTSSRPKRPACPRLRSQNRMATMIVAVPNQMHEYIGSHVSWSGLS